MLRMYSETAGLCEYVQLRNIDVFCHSNFSDICFLADDPT